MGQKPYKFGLKSHKKMVGLHPNLVRIIHRAMDMQIMDFSIIDGVRDIATQRDLVDQGVSKTMLSKHLIQQDGWGHAFDAYPYPIDMDLVNISDVLEVSRFGVLSGIMRTCAKLEGVEIINGMDWDGDGETLDHTFFDAPHFQIMGV